MTPETVVREQGQKIHVLKGIDGEMPPHLAFGICDSHGLELGQVFENRVTYSSTSYLSGSFDRKVTMKISIYVHDFHGNFDSWFVVMASKSASQ